MAERERHSLTLENTDARWLGEMERVRLDARVAGQPVAVDVSAEAVEDLAGELPLSPERLVDTVEANRRTLAEAARAKLKGQAPTGGVVLLTMRDLPKRTAPGSNRRQ
jgi:hypothetical protein